MRAVLTHEFRAEEGEVRPDALIERLPDLPSVLEPWSEE